MKAFIVKKKGQVAKAFVSDFYVGLVPDPEEHARMEAMECLYEGEPKGERLAYKKSELKSVTMFQKVEVENE